MRFGNKNEGEEGDFPKIARELVQRQYNESGIGTPRGQHVEYLPMHEIYVVWFGYVLGNWKAIVSTFRPDDRIYEVTYNREKGETYIDTYLKTHNIAIKDA